MDSDDKKINDILEISNRVLQKVNRLGYGVSNVNAIHKACKGDTRHLKSKFRNKVRNKLFKALGG